MDLRITASALTLLVLTACAVDRDDVELSYRETAEWCGDCAGFELRFMSGGHVWFTGLAGCAVPGTHHYWIPAADFDAVVQAFRRAGFFRMGRTGPMETHGGGVELSYRDNVRVHEVLDWGRRDPRLRALQRQVRMTGRPERFLTPSAELYDELLAARWNVNSKNKDGWTALTCAVARNQVEAVRLLLDHGADVSADDLIWAVGRDGAIRDVVVLRSLMARTSVDPRSEIAANMLAIAKAESNTEALSLLIDYGIGGER